MPIPFIIGALAVGAGLAGIGGHLSASDKREEAKQTNEKAKKLVDTVQGKIDINRSNTQDVIIDLGKTKIQILAGNMKKFVDSFSEIKNVELKDSIGIEELKSFNPDSQEFLNIQQASFKAMELMTGGIGGVASGTLAAMGAYGAVGALASASTGTAIASLSGAAATNATLAWLGGGALSAGGLGVAGGTAVLGATTLGIGLLVSAFYMDSKADEAVANADANYDKAREFEANGENICSLLRAISRRGTQLTDLLDRMDAHFENTIFNMADVIEVAGTNWRDYTEKEKKTIGFAVQFAQAIKFILDTPLLQEDGSMTTESEKALESGRRNLRLLTAE